MTGKDKLKNLKRKLKCLKKILKIVKEIVSDLHFNYFQFLKF